MLAAALGVVALPQSAAPVAPAVPRQERPAAVAAARPAPKAADPVAEAYYQFIRGCQLEDDGDVDGAIAAYRQAMALDPSSADVPAALAGLYARQSRVQEAIDLAKSVIAVRPAHSEAHRVLGFIYASLAEREPNDAGTQPGAAAGDRQQAIDHLESALKEARQDVVPAIRLALGRLYLKGAATDKAITVLRQLLADEPWLPQGVAMLAQAYTDAGRSADAISLLKEAVSVEPSFYEALASAYEKDKQWEEAAAAYEKASGLSPNDTDLKTRWALALLSASGDAGAAQARDLLLGVTKANPTAAWPLYLLARAQRAAGDLDESEASARRLMAINPGGTSGAHALAQVLEDRRDWDGLIKALEPVAAKAQQGRETDRAVILTHLGFAYIEVGRPADAVAAFERAAKLDPADRALRVYFAQALVAAKQFDRALEVVRAEGPAGLTDSRLARIRADALRGLGRFDDGAAVLKTLAEAAPQEALTTQYLAEYYAAAHRYAEAAALLEPAVSRFPDDTGVLFQYGAMLERQSQHREAERVFREVLAKDPANGPALNYLGYTLVERTGRLDEGVALIKRAVALDPHNGAYLDSLGWAYFKLNQLDLAEQNLKVAAAQLPRDSVVQDHWGDFLARTGRYADAVESWRRSLAGDGDDIERPKIERKIREALNRSPRD
jgi:tetratricopeptide (TPR) repeat protein